MRVARLTKSSMTFGIGSTPRSDLRRCSPVDWKPTMETHPPGTHAARLLFGKGLWFGAVVRGLVEQVGLSEEEATRAAQIAAAERILAEAPRQQSSEGVDG